MKTILNRWVSGLAVILLLGFGLTMSSCEKEMDDSEKLDVVIPYYYNNNYNPEWSLEAINNYVAKDCVRHIYITIMPGETFTSAESRIISWQRKGLAKVMAISPKISGRGNFVFKPGICAVEDSLALVEMGFTINRQDK